MAGWGGVSGGRGVCGPVHFSLRSISLFCWVVSWLGFRVAGLGTGYIPTVVLAEIGGMLLFDLRLGVKGEEEEEGSLAWLAEERAREAEASLAHASLDQEHNLSITLLLIVNG